MLLRFYCTYLVKQRIFIYPKIQKKKIYYVHAEISGFGFTTLISARNGHARLGQFHPRTEYKPKITTRDLKQSSHLHYHCATETVENDRIHKDIYPGRYYNPRPLF